MRPGLVVVGAAFVLSAAVSGASMFVLPPNPVDHQVSTELPNVEVGPNGTGAALLSGTNSSEGSFDLVWQSSGPLTVALFRTSGCTVAGPTCRPIGTAVSWNRSMSGQFTESGHLSYPYLLEWTDPGRAPISFGADSVSHATIHPAPSAVTVLVVEIAAGALGAVGGVALFLGLFLRRGAYAAPLPLVSRGADDADAIALSGGTPPATTDPRTAPSGDGSGSPRQEPPARGRSEGPP